MGTRIIRLVGIMALLAGALSFGVAASAANPTNGGQGSQVLKVHDCQPDPYLTGYTDCIDEQVEFHNIDGNANAADNISAQVNGKACFTLIDPSGTVVSVDCEQFHEHVLVKG